MREKKFVVQSTAFCDAAVKVRDVQCVSLSLRCNIVIRFRLKGGLIRQTDAWQLSSASAAADVHALFTLTKICLLILLAGV